MILNLVILKKHVMRVAAMREAAMIMTLESKRMILFGKTLWKRSADLRTSVWT